MTGDSDDDPRLVDDLREEVDQLGRVVDAQERTVARLERELRLLSAALGWRLQLRLEPFRKAMLATPVLRQIYRALYRALDLWVDQGLARVFAQARHKIGLALSGRPFLVEARRVQTLTLEEQYQAWIRTRGASPDAAAMRSTIARLRSTPLVSVLTVLRTPEVELAHRLIETLRAQGYERWELCLATPRRVRSAIGEQLDALQRAESRLRLADSADTATLDDSLRIAGGEFVTVLDARDDLAPEALVELMRRLDEQPVADIVYSDEDWTTDGRRHDPMFKPDWSPDLLLSVNYLACCGLFRMSLVRRAGGFRESAGGAEVYDLVLRVTEASQAIAHVPKVLCHRRTRDATVDGVLERRAAARDEQRVLREALDRRGRPGQVAPLFARRGPRCYATRVALRERPLVSIVIPTKNKRKLLETTIESLFRQTSYDRFEVIVVDNGSTEADAVHYLASLAPRCQVLQWSAPFNYSAINNFGVAHAKGEQVLFLNNDVEVIAPDWLTAMVEHAVRKEVGAVGARLLYRDGRIQHAGVVVGINRAAANAFRGWAGESIGSPRLADLTRNCSAVTGACMMMPRRLFDEVGGFNEELRVVLNDVDLCLRIRQKGYLIVYEPGALLYHYEGSSRGLLHPPPDQRRFEELWGAFLDAGDPYYNVNLSDRHDDWSIRV